MMWCSWQANAGYGMTPCHPPPAFVNPPCHRSVDHQGGAGRRDDERARALRRRVTTPAGCRPALPRSAKCGAAGGRDAGNPKRRCTVVKRLRRTPGDDAAGRPASATTAALPSPVCLGWNPARTPGRTAVRCHRAVLPATLTERRRGKETAGRAGSARGCRRCRAGANGPPADGRQTPGADCPARGRATIGPAHRTGPAGTSGTDSRGPGHRLKQTGATRRGRCCVMPVETVRAPWPFRDVCRSC